MPRACFACFTGTKVQILTLRTHIYRCASTPARACPRARRALICSARVPIFRYIYRRFTGTTVLSYWYKRAYLRLARPPHLLLHLHLLSRMSTTLYVSSLLYTYICFLTLLRTYRSLYVSSCYYYYVPTGLARPPHLHLYLLSCLPHRARHFGLL